MDHQQPDQPRRVHLEPGSSFHCQFCGNMVMLVDGRNAHRCQEEADARLRYRLVQAFKDKKQDAQAIKQEVDRIRQTRPLFQLGELGPILADLRDPHT